MAKPAKKVKRRTPTGRFIIYFHRLEEDGYGPPWDNKGRWDDLDDFELFLESQKFGLKCRQECEILAFEDEGDYNFDDYTRPDMDPHARWHLFVDRDGDVVVKRLEAL